MDHVPLLDEIAIIAAIGVVVSVLFARMRFPTTAGLLVAGALVGPAGLGLIRSTHDIQLLAEVGVVFLLFTIGLEFSLERLSRIAKLLTVGGSLQVGGTVLLVAIGTIVIGQDFARAIFYGCVVALSSTAIVLRALGDRGEMDAPHGRFIVGVLIFQDLCVVPMVLVVPLLVGDVGGIGTAIGLALGKAALVVVLVMVLSRLIVPRVLSWVDVTRSREVFVLAVIGVCIGTAFLTSLAGLSLALGAFLGGVVVADTDFRHRALSEVLPLRDLFTSLFFVSLGMLFDLRVVLGSPIAVLLFFLAFTLLKGTIATLAAMAMRFPARVAWLAGVGLAQFGEFGFVLTTLARGVGVIGDEEQATLLAAGVLSMFATPLLVRLAPHVRAGEKLLRPLERLLGTQGIDEAAPEHANLEGHVILVGFGVAGRLLASSLDAENIAYIGLELNVDTVRRERAAGRAVYYGDASSLEALHHAHVESARAIVLLMNDPDALERTIAALRTVSKDVAIVVRTRYLAQRDRLLAIGATDVMCEEVEGGVEMLTRVLRLFDVPRNVLDDAVQKARGATQESARPVVVPRRALGEVGDLAELKVEPVRIGDDSYARGKSMLDLELRKETRALVIAFRRGGALREDPDPAEPFESGDVLYLVGTRRSVREATHFLVRGRRDSLA